MNENDAVNELIATLRPDALTEDAYRRRRSADLARAIDSPRTRHNPRRSAMSQRRPLLLIAGTAAAGLAAAVIVVPHLSSGNSPRPDSSGRLAIGTSTPKTTASSTGVRTVNVRTVLLAAATVAAKEPVDAGRFWYSRVHTSQLVRVAPKEYMTKIRALIAEQEARTKELKGRPAELKAYTKDWNKRVTELKMARLPYIATRAETTETWRSLKHGTGREVRDQDVRIAFATPEDEAKWKRAGSPALSGDDRPRTKEGAPEGIVSIDNPSLTWSNVSKLPTDKEGLKARLKSLYAQSPDKGKGLAAYMSATGWDLLTAPITPGTRAALYQVLADTASGLTSHAGVADGLGRTGVSLETTGPDDYDRPGRITYRLIFDDRTAKVLELDVIEAGTSTPLLRQTFETTGYVDKPGDLPQR
jgi:hypothetical protein